MTQTTDTKAEASIRLYLHGDQAFDYDNLVDILGSESEEAGDFDVFVRLAFTISEMTLTRQEMSCAARMIANFAVNALEFNVCEGGNQPEENLEAINEAKQNARIAA